MKEIKEYLAQIAVILGCKEIRVTRLTNTGWVPFGEEHYYNTYTKDEGMNIRLDIDGDNNYLAKFTLVQLPGCCGVCVSTGAEVYAVYRNKGIGRILNKLRQQMAKDFGYTVLLCTDVASNKVQQKILTEEKFDLLYSFNNKRTGNDVNIHLLPL